MLTRLSLMMFLEYWPLGLWAVTLGTYLLANTADQGTGMFSPGFVGLSASAGALGSLFSPVLAGVLSDRYFRAQHLVALLHLASGLSVLWMYATGTQFGFFLAMLIYFQCFVPTVTLTNAIALRHVEDIDRDFSITRTFGTVGWVAAGLFVGFAWPWLTGDTIEATRTPLMLSVVSHGAMALYSLTLPDTPPGRSTVAKGWQLFIGGSDLWSNRPFVFFLLLSIVACMPSIAYGSYGNAFLNEAGMLGAAGQQTFGQVSEVICLLGMSLLVRRIGLKRLLVLGMLSWAFRYGCLAWGSMNGSFALFYSAIAVHGTSYVFIYVASQIYVDRLADEQSRGAAQGLHALAGSGLGHLLGAGLCALTEQGFLIIPSDEPLALDRWFIFWAVPGALSLVVAVVFMLCFKEPSKRRVIDDEDLLSAEASHSPAEAIASKPIDWHGDEGHREITESDHTA